MDLMLLRGIDLKYTGGKATEFISDDYNITHSMRFRKAISNVGAFTMRIQLGQAQRAALLQGVCRENYQDNPMQKVAEGGNQSNLFFPGNQVSDVCRVTRELEQLAHYPIGRGKILNERAQPQKQRNTEGLRGEEYLWDVLHSPVWGIGLNLAGQLVKQGFTYICHPIGMTLAESLAITQALKQGAFKKIKREDRIIIQTASGIELETARMLDLDISIDAKHTITQQDNAFVVSYRGNKAPIGWMMHSAQTDQIVDPQYTEDVLRAMCIAKGGTHKLSEIDYYLLIEHTRSKTDGVRFTQNRTFNLLDETVRTFERDYQFNPMKLIGESIAYSYKTIQERMKTSDVTEDFLTGILISEMVQPLKMTLTNSTRIPLPHEFGNSFDITQNNAKAFAYAYDITKKDGSLAFVPTANPFITEPDDDLIDVRLHGYLQNPTLSNPKHSAALLATAMLVAEQMLLEQLLRDACQHGDTHQHAIALKEIVTDEAVYNQLVAMATALPHNDKGPILGLQLSVCEPVVALLRATLGFHHIEKIAKEFYCTDTYSTSSLDNEALLNALNTLFKIGNMLQKLPEISAASQASRGLNAGVIPVIELIFPRLYARLVESGEMMPHVAECEMQISKHKPSLVQAEGVAESDSNIHTTAAAFVDNASHCPYLNRLEKHAVPASLEQHVVTDEKQNVTACHSLVAQCGLFARQPFYRIVALGVAAAATATAVSYLGFRTTI